MLQHQVIVAVVSLNLINKMAKGSVVVLHKRNDASDREKVETNNIGFQSTVDFYYKQASALVSDFSKQRQIKANLLVNLDEINSLLQTYIYVANRLYELMYRIASENNKIGKMLEIEQGALQWTS